MINFRRIKTGQDVANYIANLLSARLSKGQPVLWLIAGGSAIDIAVKVSFKLKAHQNLNCLSVSLTDERYGPVDYKDSNWRQLKGAGFLLPRAHLWPVLNGESLEKTAEEYQRILNDQLAKADFSLALAGMGADGHIFGIKPNSPAASSPKGVVGYQWDDYTRITPTLNLIKKLDEVVVYAVGQEKHPQIDKLDIDMTVSEQPAQALKQLRKVVFFNDYKGEAV